MVILNKGRVLSLLSKWKSLCSIRLQKVSSLVLQNRIKGMMLPSRDTCICFHENLVVEQDSKTGRSKAREEAAESRASSFSLQLPS